MYAHKAAPSKDLVQTIETFKPTVLIGVSTKGGAFNQQVVESMSRLNERPIIFALSNPTDRAECSAEQAYTWSNGKALYAAGVQFPEVTLEWQDLPPRAGEQLLHLPGNRARDLRGATATHHRRVLHRGGARERRSGGPGTARQGHAVPEPSRRPRDGRSTTATRVAEFMFDKGLAQVERPRDIRGWIEGQLYNPQY